MFTYDQVRRCDAVDDKNSLGGCIVNDFNDSLFWDQQALQQQWKIPLSARDRHCDAFFYSFFHAASATVATSHGHDLAVVLT